LRFDASNYRLAIDQDAERYLIREEYCKSWLLTKLHEVYVDPPDGNEELVGLAALAFEIHSS